MSDGEEEQEEEVLSLSTSDGVPEQQEDADYEEEEQSALQVLATAATPLICKEWPGISIHIHTS